MLGLGGWDNNKQDKGGSKLLVEKVREVGRDRSGEQGIMEGYRRNMGRNKWQIKIGRWWVGFQ